MVRGIRQRLFAKPGRKTVKDNRDKLLKSRSAFGEWGVQMYSDGKISSSDLGEGAAATASERGRFECGAAPVESQASEETIDRQETEA